MRLWWTIALLLLLLVSGSAFIGNGGTEDPYRDVYMDRMRTFREGQEALIRTIRSNDPATTAGRNAIRADIHAIRTQMKAVDIWLRYIGPTLYGRINAPIPVEWETEVFEKQEKPHQRIGGGLTLAELYLNEEAPSADSLAHLVRTVVLATDSFLLPPATDAVGTPDAFLFANRLFLLDLASIYTTGFECPDTSRVIPELKAMLHATLHLYGAFATRFPQAAPPASYLNMFTEMVRSTDLQSDAFSRFDHFTFIQRYVDPLFAMAQAWIATTHASSHSYMDFTLSMTCRSIFGKDLYFGQDAKGVYKYVQDSATLADIRAVGRSLFHDPILSGNNARSCASCHRTDHYFTDTVATAARFDRSGGLARNTPSLLEVGYNHLLMLDGRHATLQAQARGVITSPTEMACSEQEALRKVMSCARYRRVFRALLRATPQEHDVNIGHLVSAITYYYTDFSGARSAFDEAMDAGGPLDPSARRGFDLFMSKAACATCHFVPVFNGVKPPFISSEFEVLGVPADAQYRALSPDTGRAFVNDVPEMRGAFRTGSLRNVEHTAPYMHNGVFRTLEEVIDFYDSGGGAGHGLAVEGQTLPTDSLHLSAAEKADLIAFLRSLSERTEPDVIPVELPRSRDRALNSRAPGGIY